MKLDRKFYIDVTTSNPNGAPPKESFEFKPLNVRRYLQSPRRQTTVEAAPSLIAGKLYNAPGAKE